MTDPIPRVGTPDHKNEIPVMRWKSIGWPSLLLRLDCRLFYHRLPEDAQQITPESKSKARDVLLKHNLLTADSEGIADEEIRVENTWRHRTLPGRPTLTMAIKWSDEKHKSIRLAAQEIAEYVRHSTEAFPYTFYVEITSIDLVMLVYYCPTTDLNLRPQ
ncbi:hypothetical protein FSPOR_3459 [Fusarium sporotrichioides]|uniref:Uncharacterized protein n=1 Tax=Fusarium sporotrichioides TaxID=5514 RepID=A0A395SG16_FUSSP|nr:hypothetical protein FSPOR_3459 [Fusarium sporotrichioides]